MITGSSNLVYSTLDLKTGHFYKDSVHDLFIWVKVRDSFYAIGCEGISWSDDTIVFPCVEIFTIYQDGKEG